jgi:hypothetical protein
MQHLLFPACQLRSSNPSGQDGADGRGHPRPADSYSLDADWEGLDIGPRTIDLFKTYI